MQNKCNRGCNAGFVPAGSNWDFNIGGDWLRTRGNQQRTRNQNTCPADCAAQQTTRSNCKANACTPAAAAANCPNEACADPRAAQCCGQNTALRSQQENSEPCNAGCARTACTGQANCTCERCTRVRAACSAARNVVTNASGSGAAASCEPACQQQPACTDNAGNTNNSGGYNGCYGGRSNLEAMVNIDVQQLGETFASESALRAGTLFPELHKPLNGYCPCDSNCGTIQQAAAFAAWELRLYLDTHPQDQQALALFRQLCREAGEDTYATAFLPDSCCNTTAWNWTNDPWPWEYPCRCGD